MLKQLGPSIRMMLIFTILLGLVYPGIVTGICQLLFHEKANGSLVTVNGQVVGSSLIAQGFSKPDCFQPRPSAAGNGFDPTQSNGSQYGPTNQKLIDRLKTSIDAFHKDNPDFHGPIPSDLLTTSASGLDPDLSPAAVEAQAPRVARARGVSPEAIENLIAQHIQGRQLGFLGEPRANVLELNLDLDREFPKK